MKVCTRCHENKTLSEFRPDERYRMGVTGHCIKCRNEAIRLRGEQVKLLPKPEIGSKECITCKQTKDYSQFSRKNAALDGRKSRCKECSNNSVVAVDYRMSPERQLRRRLKRYGMSVKDFHQMIDDQDGKCGCCFKPFTRPAVDHDHTTGAIRMILCFSCNSKIAALEDEKFVSNAKAYLEKCRAMTPTFMFCARTKERINALIERDKKFRNE